MTIIFNKCHGCENDFIIIDNIDILSNEFMLTIDSSTPLSGAIKNLGVKGSVSGARYNGGIRISACYSTATVGGSTIACAGLTTLTMTGGHVGDDPIEAKGVNLRTVILYGSFAKGTQHKWSDIDVALVADEFTGQIDASDIYEKFPSGK